MRDFLERLGAIALHPGLFGFHASSDRVVVVVLVGSKVLGVNVNVKDAAILELLLPSHHFEDHCCSSVASKLGSSFPPFLKPAS
jgi:hypothetical protein